MGLVTIGLPFYNAEATLLDAIRSVFAQSFQDWELILVDDGSRDRSLEIARGVHDSRVRVVSDGMNRGLPARLNQITELAQGEYVARMDADDLMHPARLAREVKCLNEHPEVDLVYTAYYTIDAKNRPVGKQREVSPEMAAHRLRRGKGILHASVLARRSWFRKHPYNPSEFPRAEDIELWWRTNLQGHLRFHRLPERLYFIRELGSVTLRKMLASYRTDRKILWRYGPQTLGWLDTLWEIGKFYLKSATYCVATACGQQDALVRQRCMPLTRQERLSVESVVAKIVSTPVPVRESGHVRLSPSPS
jgi:glycosyltransferase involved in cell wall biosynthesis